MKTMLLDWNPSNNKKTPKELFYIFIDVGAILPLNCFNASLNELVKSSSGGKNCNSWRKLQKFKVFFFFFNPLKGSLPLNIFYQHFQQNPGKKKKEKRKDSQLLLHTVITTSLSRFPLGAPGDPLSRCERPDPTCLHRPGLHRAARNVGSCTDVYTCLFNSQHKAKKRIPLPLPLPLVSQFHELPTNILHQERRAASGKNAHCRSHFCVCRVA